MGAVSGGIILVDGGPPSYHEGERHDLRWLAAGSVSMCETMFYQPTTMEEALAIRAEHGRGVLPVGGGTDIVVVLNRGGKAPAHFLDLGRIEGYSDVTEGKTGWMLGGGATFSYLERLPVRVLANAAASVGGPAIRNRGTIGGNLGTASPAGDACVALVSLDAEIRVASAARGERVIPVGQFFKGVKQTVLEPDELIVSVLCPADWRSAWHKIGKRSSINISLVCCGVGLSPAGDVRIAFGCVAPTVVRAVRAEAEISANGLTDAAIDEAAKIAMTEVSPISDHRASADYRRAMCGVSCGRLLRQLRDEAERGTP